LPSAAALLKFTPYLVRFTPSFQGLTTDDEMPAAVAADEAEVRDDTYPRWLTACGGLLLKNETGDDAAANVTRGETCRATHDLANTAPAARRTTNRIVAMGRFFLPPVDRHVRWMRLTRH
jgi:hypothetical protein